MSVRQGLGHHLPSPPVYLFPPQRLSREAPRGPQKVTGLRALAQLAPSSGFIPASFMPPLPHFLCASPPHMPLGSSHGRFFAAPRVPQAAATPLTSRVPVIFTRRSHDPWTWNQNHQIHLPLILPRGVGWTGFREAPRLPSAHPPSKALPRARKQPGIGLSLLP